MQESFKPDQSHIKNIVYLQFKYKVSKLCTYKVLKKYLNKGVNPD
jgi:hypothetical protein